MSDTAIQDTTIEPLATVPARLLGVRRELNLLRYGPSELLVARRGEEIVGAVRLAQRDDPELRHGLITDLTVETDQEGNCGPPGAFDRGGGAAAPRARGHQD